MLARLSAASAGRMATLGLPTRRLYSSDTGSKGTSTTALASIGFFLAAAGAYYYEARSASPYEPTFHVKIRGQDLTFTRKSDAEIEKALTENEDGAVVDRPGNPVVRWDRNVVASNEPCEDRSAVDIIPRPRGVNEIAKGDSGPRTIGDRDITLFSILDGHAGWATAELLKKVLHPTLALSLAALQAEAASKASWNPLAWVGSRSWDPPTIASTIQKAFVELDDNICQTPVSLIPTVPTSPLDAGYAAGAPAFIAMAEPAQSGACAMSTIVDAENDDLYVALTGDCRAVAGWQDKDGNWRCDTLTEDQMGENPREVNRMIAEHPASESSTVIMRGRVQGGLQPTRAFGDAVYKWTSEQADHIYKIFQAEGLGVRAQRGPHFTPPYVTAEPVVTHRKLHSPSGENLKFLVLATDGLWDRITSEEATLLVASYLAHAKHADIPKAQLAAQIPLVPAPAERPYPAQDLPGSPSRSEGTWSFEGDTNAATHLIRNALAGGDRKTRGELLSITGKTCRRFRDDTTVTVVFFN